MESFLKDVLRWSGEHPLRFDFGVVVGVAGTLFCAVGLRVRPRLAAVLIAVAGGSVALALSCDTWLHPWDERFHALVAKNLLKHFWLPTLYDVRELAPGGVLPGSWGSTYVWLHKPPLATWAIALSFKVFGLHELAVRLPSIVMAAVAILATYFIGERLLGARVALWAAFLQGMNGCLLELAAGRVPTDHPDSLLSSFTALGMAVAVEHHRTRSRILPPIIGIICGLAILTKWLPGLIILGVWSLFLPWRDDFKRAIGALAFAVLPCIAVSIPWQIHLLRAFPVESAVESAYSWQHFVEPLEGHSGSWAFYFARLPRTFGEMSPLAIGWFLWKKCFRERTHAGAFLATWAFLPYAIYSFAATKMPGYVLPAAPAIFLMISSAFCDAIVPSQPAGVSPRLALRSMAFLLIALPIRFTIERWKPFHRNREEMAISTRLRTIDSTYGTRSCALFGEPRPIEAMFYGRCVAFPFPPSLAQRKKAESLGFEVALVHSDSTQP